MENCCWLLRREMTSARRFQQSDKTECVNDHFGKACYVLLGQAVADEQTLTADSETDSV